MFLPPDLMTKATNSDYLSYLSEKETPTDVKNPYKAYSGEVSQ